MNIKERLNRCCGRYFAPAIKCEEGSRCSDCFDKIEGWREIERLQEAIVEIMYQIGQGSKTKAMEIAAPIAEAHIKQKAK